MEWPLYIEIGNYSSYDFPSCFGLFFGAMQELHLFTAPLPPLKPFRPYFPGSCTMEKGQPKCTCDPGYGGALCQLALGECHFCKNGGKAHRRPVRIL